MRTIVKTDVILPAAIIFIMVSCRYFSDSDHSFPPEEYREMGMPDHTRIWNFKDYSEACAVLNNIKSIKPLSLPLKDSHRSGVIFSRIINTENLSFLVSDSMSLSEKAMLIQKYIDIQGCMVTAYTDINSKKQYYNRELIDLYIFGITIAQDMLDLGRQINESVSDKDIELQYAYGSVRKMYSTMVILVLMNQQKAYFFEKEDLERLSDFMYNSILINHEWMKDSPTEGIRLQLEKIVKQTSSEDIRDKYSKLLDML